GSGASDVIVVVVSALLSWNVKDPLVTEPPVSAPPAETVKLRVPAGVAADVVIVNVVVFVVPEPLNVAGENVAFVPFGAGPPIHVIDQLPEQLPFDLVRVMLVYVTVCPGTGAEGDWETTETVLTVHAAAVYGPTKGPPAPTGSAPAGWIESVPVSSSARARLTRPLPVWAWLPAGSAVRARRPTITPLVSAGSTAFRSAAAPATIAAEAEVPVASPYGA